MKHLIILAAVMALVIACQKDEPLQPDLASNASAKQEALVISEIWEGSRLIKKYSYQDKRLAMIEYWGGTSDIITYDDIHRRIKLDQPRSNPRTWFIYQFNEQNRMESWTRWTYNKPAVKRTYYYEKDRLTRVTTRGFPDAPYPYSNDWVYNWTTPRNLTYVVVFVDVNEVPFQYDTTYFSWHTPYQLTAYWAETPDELTRFTYSNKIKSPTYNQEVLPFMEEIRDNIPRKELFYQRNTAAENESPQMLQLSLERTENKNGTYRYEWRLDEIRTNEASLPTQYVKVYMDQWGQEYSRVTYTFKYVAL